MFKYFGSKYRLGSHYPEPQLDVICEPFAGSAAYAVRNRHVSTVYLIEKDPRVVDLWLRLLVTPVADLLGLPDPVEGAWSEDLLVAFAAGRTTRDTPSRFRVSPRMAQRYRPMVKRISEVLDECRHFKVIEGDYASAPDISATWFIDPPYQGQGGRWDRTRGGRYLYPNRDINFADLADWCQSRMGQVIVCEQYGADWLPWNGEKVTYDNLHKPYGEVWWYRPVEG